MIVSLIAAVAENGVIGKDNNLIWCLPKDIVFFRKTTMGHHVIMGRKNFESIPHKYCPLPGRTNIVISRQQDYIANGCHVVNSIEDALSIAQQNKDKEPFIIGGEEIYKLALDKNLVDKIYITKIHQEFEGDAFFPLLPDEWKEISKIENKANEKNAFDFSFICLEKIN